MSRGGRGGGGWRGGRAKPGTARIGGVDISIDDDLDRHLQSNESRPQPGALFPPYDVTPMKPLSTEEKIQVARFRALREEIHNGPLYTVLGDNVKVTKPGTKGGFATPQFNAFESMQTYSQRYKQKKRRVPKLDTRSYVLKFFPKELWSTLDPEEEYEKKGHSPLEEKKQQIGLSRLDTIVADDGRVVGERGDADNEKLKDDEEQEAQEEIDDEFGSDEESMAGDYNAEQYFDDGGDDAGDDYDAGEADGGEY